jgi:hypothetical protein
VQGSDKAVGHQFAPRRQRRTLEERCKCLHAMFQALRIIEPVDAEVVAREAGKVLLTVEFFSVARASLGTLFLPRSANLRANAAGRELCGWQRRDSFIVVWNPRRSGSKVPTPSLRHLRPEI